MSVFQINRRMFVYKFFYFFSISAMSITPFMGLYLKQLGLTPSKIGMITAARPVFGLVSGPIIGLLTDRFQCPKLVIFVCGILWMSSAFVMGNGVPSPEERTCEMVQENAQLRCLQEGRRPIDNYNMVKRRDVSSSSVVEFQSSVFINRSADCNVKDLFGADDRSWLFTEQSLHKVFWILILASGFFGLSFNALHSIADSASLNALEESGEDMADYGKQRAFGSLGWGIAPLIYGAWIISTRDTASRCGIMLTTANYHPMFHIFLIMAAGAMVSTIFFSYTYKSSQTPALERSLIIDIFCVPIHGAILLAVTFIGVCNGSIQGYLYWHVDNIGGTELLMGLASACHALSEFTLGMLSGWLTRRFGYLLLINVGILTYLVRFVLYAVITQPWWILATEIFHSLTFLLTWNTSLSYLSLVVPPNFRTSLASLLNALYLGVGNVIGYLGSGYLITLYGARVTFYIHAVACVVVSVFFICVSLMTTKMSKKDEDVEATDDDQVFIEPWIHGSIRYTDVPQQVDLCNVNIE